MTNNKYYSNNVVEYDSDYSDEEEIYSKEDKDEKEKQIIQLAQLTKKKLVVLFSQIDIKLGEIQARQKINSDLLKNGKGDFRERMKINNDEILNITNNLVDIRKEIALNIEKAREITLSDAKVILENIEDEFNKGGSLEITFLKIENIKTDYVNFVKEISLYIKNNVAYKKEFKEIIDIKNVIEKLIRFINTFIKNYTIYEYIIEILKDFKNDLKHLIDIEDLHNIYIKLQQRRGDKAKNDKIDLLKIDFRNMAVVIENYNDKFINYSNIKTVLDEKIQKIKQDNIYNNKLIEFEKIPIIKNNINKFYYDLLDEKTKDPKFNLSDDNRKTFMNQHNNNIVEIVDIITKYLNKTTQDINTKNNKDIVDELNKAEELKNSDLIKKLDENSGLDEKTKKDLLKEEEEEDLYLEKKQLQDFNKRKNYDLTETEKKDLLEVKVNDFILFLSQSITYSNYDMAYPTMIDNYEDFINTLLSYEGLNITTEHNKNVMKIIREALNKKISILQEENINIRENINFMKTFDHPKIIQLQQIENSKEDFEINKKKIKTLDEQLNAKYDFMKNYEAQNDSDIDEGENKGKGLKKKKTISKSEILKIIKQSKQKIKKSKKGGNFLDAVSQIEHQQEPKNVREYLQAYGNLEIDNIVLHRTPIDGKINTLLNIITLGQFEQNKKDLNIDSMFHLYMTVQLKGKSGYTRIEKNQTVTMTDIENPRSTDEYEIPYHPRINLKVLFQNGLASLAEKVGSGNEYNYNGQNNNCQIFLMSLLDGNAIDNNESVKFILQDTNYVVGHINSVAKSIMKGAIDLAQFTNILIYGAGFYR